MELKLGMVLLGLVLMAFGLFLKDLYKLFTSNARSLDPKYMNDTNSTWETVVDVDENGDTFIKSHRRYYFSRYL